MIEVLALQITQVRSNYQCCFLTKSQQHKTPMILQRDILLSQLAAAFLSSSSHSFTTMAPKIGTLTETSYKPLSAVQVQDTKQQLREIARFGTMAANSHNTQCWKIELDSDEKKILVLPDLTRRTPVVDPDDHHLYCTLGCAVENMVIAACSYGYHVEVDSSHPREGIELLLTPTKSPSTKAEQIITHSLFQAIPKRQCSRTVYDGKPLTSDELDQLCRAGTGNGVQVLLLTDQESKDMILKHVQQANTAQLENPEFKKELKTWVRFGGRDAHASSDGLYGPCMGNPSIPKFLGGHIFDWVARPGPENAKIETQVKSSAGFAVFVSDQDDAPHWVEVGRCYERFALQATALGIRNAFLNMPVEVTEHRPIFAQELGIGHGRPDLVVRFGKGPEMPRSLRRPLEEVVHEK